MAHLFSVDGGGRRGCRNRGLPLTLEKNRKGPIMGQLRNPHPGEILKEEFLNEIGVSQNQLAQAVGVPGNRIHAIVNGTRDITADTDLRLCKFFGLTEELFFAAAECLRHVGG
jgi:addiction module HigA family antidote